MDPFFKSAFELVLIFNQWEFLGFELKIIDLFIFTSSMAQLCLA